MLAISQPSLSNWLLIGSLLTIHAAIGIAIRIVLV